MLKRLLAGAAAAASICAAAQAHAQQFSDGKVKIGVLTDLSGGYSDLAGPGSVTAARMAVEDFGGVLNGAPIELVAADHQNKADIASSVVRRWYDVEQVDAVFDLVGTAVSMAVREVSRDKGRIDMNSGGGSVVLTNEKCAPLGFHWAFDVYAMAAGTGYAVTRQGGDSWYFLTADYAFGHDLEKQTSRIVQANGGVVKGSVRHPFPNPDFSSFLLQAQASKAKIIGLANAGADTINAIKQAGEFGVAQGGQSLAGLMVFITDVHSLGLETAQGMLLTTGFYWDRDDKARAFSKRFAERMKGKMPTTIQAGVYSSVLHYLRSVQAAGTDESVQTAEKIRTLPINDPFAENGKVRPDGRMVHDMYLAQVKSPAESKGPWDYYKLVRTIPGDEAFKPLSESTCPLVKK